ncbi:MAG: BTAD domain-containing putative transcriptional regulator [Caldilineaceae bacterium]
MSATLHIYLLGDFRLSDSDNKLIVVPQARYQALLTFLLLHHHAPQARRHLAFLLWPDSSEPQALTNLRKALTHLRQMSPILAQAIYADNQVVQWRPAASFSLDIVEFEAKLNQATAAAQNQRFEEALDHWSGAVALYTGPLTPSCYDDWVVVERERLHQLCLGALERLVAGYEQQQAFAIAIPYAQQLLRLDPLQESMYLHLMRLQALQGDRAGALRTYHTCAALLASELGIDPSPETQAAHARLLNLETGAKTLLPIHHATRLVGRRTEWGVLQQKWRQATTQGIHFVCVWGEAGIGKTHLSEEVLSWAGQQGFSVARTRAYAGEGHLAYAPVIAWLRTEAIQRVRSRLAPVWLSEVARLLPEILSEQPTVLPPEPMTEAWQRQRLWEALVRALLAAPQPLLLLLDDLHWCDRETLEWLRYLLHFEPKAKLLLVGTARPEEVDGTHPLQALCRHLRGSDQLSEIELNPLDKTETVSLATQIAQQALAEQTQQLLYRATAGNPLFIVEMTRAGLNKENWVDATQSGPLPALPVPAFVLPPKVQAVIQTRLTQLSPVARELAQFAATIGQDFTFDVLMRASKQDEDAVVRALDELWQRRIIRRHGSVAYDFSHDRIRDVAYEEMSHIRRRSFHRRIAQTLEGIFAHNLSIVCGQLAVHYEQAGLPAQAIEYYSQAAEKERQLFATNEALAYLNCGFDLLKRFPETPKGKEHELTLQLALGNIWVPIKGSGSIEVGQIYDRALVLCEQITATPQLFPALWGLHEVYLYRAEYAKAIKLCERCMQIAEQAGDEGLLLQAYHALWGVHFYCGSVPLALQYAKLGLAIYNTGKYQAHAIEYVIHDTGMCALLIAGLSLWLLGYPEQAKQKLADLAALTETLTLPILIADAAMQTASFYQCLSEIAPTQAYLQKSIELSVKYGYSTILTNAIVVQGWTFAMAGDSATGIKLMRQGLAEWQATGQSLLYNYFYALLVEGYAIAGRNAEGIELLKTAQAFTAQRDDRFYRAEIYRLEGDLLLAQGEAFEQVEIAYTQAIEIARQQSEKLFELRAATGLARLWQQQGRTSEAYQLLAEIYHWFKEGFDTADLQTAQALLSEIEAICAFS